MFGKKQPKTDLTSAEAVAKSQKVYQGIVTGKVKNAKAALDKAHGTNSQQS